MTFRNDDGKKEEKEASDASNRVHEVTVNLVPHAVAVVSNDNSTDSNNAANNFKSPREISQCLTK